KEQALEEALRATARANEQTQRANQEAERANQESRRANHNLAKARQAVRAFLNSVDAQPVLQLFEFSDLRVKLLNEAVPFYEEFARKQGDARELEAERAQPFDDLGFLRYSTGDTKQAAADWEKMRAICLRLAETRPDDPKVLALLGSSRVDCAI